MNPILLTDSYKVSHAKQYPPGTQKVYSYFESRGGKFPATVFFGLQAILERHFLRPVTTGDIQEAEELFSKHLSSPAFNRAGWEHIVAVHGGRLPVSIKAVPEGTVVPTGNVLMTVENTCPECYWVTNYIETLLVQVWYPTTVATLSREAKISIAANLMETSGSLAGLEFKLHDFGCRGVSSMESAGLGGLAHLVNFQGTDTVPALVYGRRYYDEDMAGLSIPAAEHSTITSWGKEHEVDAFRNMLDTYPVGPVAVVSDSYDIYKACREHWGKTLRDKVLGRDGFLVVRPDSGEPTKVVVEVLEILGEAFGFTVNSYGYKVLDPHIRVIQGDGVNLDSIRAILKAMKEAGWSGENLAFGMGGALLQQVNRDTCKFAFKASYAVVAGDGRDVFKEPVDAPWKASKKGRLMLIRGGDGEFMTLRENDNEYPNFLVEVYRDGKIVNRSSFKQVRARASIPTPPPPVVVTV